MKGLTAKLLIILTTLILTLSIKATTYALTAEILLDSNSLAAGESMQLQVSVNGSVNAAPPQFKTVNGLQIVYHGPSTSIQIVNGKYSASTAFNYSVLGVKTGTYTLGPLTVKAGGKTLQTNRVQITVTPATAPVQPPQSVNRNEEADNSGSLDGQLKKRLFLTMDLPRSTFYTGEAIKTTIRLYVGGIQIQDINYPTIKSADGCQVDIGKPATVSRNLNGAAYKVLEFPTTISFIKTGKFTLGPATLQCNAMIPRQSHDSFFDSFFTDYEEYPQTLTSKSFDINVQAPPSQPNGFSGGIGDFNLAVTAAPREVLAGDPITVRLTVTGQGNLAAIAPPVLQKQAGLKVYDAQRKTNKSEANFGNKAVFEQIIFPLSNHVTAIGPYSLVYFDPAKGSYQTATAAAIPIKVKPNPNLNLSSAGNPTDSTGDQLGQGLVYIKDSPGKLQFKNTVINRQPWFWLLQLLPLAVIGGAFFYRRHHELQNSNTPLARALRADNQAGKELNQAAKLLEAAAYDQYLDELHRIFREYLANKFQLAAGGITGAVTAQLADSGLEATTLQNISTFFEQYDLFRFTQAKLTRADAERLRDLVITIITANQRKNSIKGCSDI